MPHAQCFRVHAVVPFRHRHRRTIERSSRFQIEPNAAKNRASYCCTERSGVQARKTLRWLLRQAVARGSQACDVGIELELVAVLGCVALLADRDGRRLRHPPRRLRVWFCDVQAARAVTALAADVSQTLVLHYGRTARLRVARDVTPDAAQVELLVPRLERGVRATVLCLF